MFLLPLGVSPIESIDIDRNTYLRSPKPNPPPRTYISNIVPKSSDMSYYDFLLNKLEFNNNEYVSKILSDSSDNPPSPPSRQKLEPIFESQEVDEFV